MSGCHSVDLTCTVKGTQQNQHHTVPSALRGLLLQLGTDKEGLTHRHGDLHPQSQPDLAQLTALGTWPSGLCSSLGWCPSPETSLLSALHQPQNSPCSPSVALPPHPCTTTTLVNPAFMARPHRVPAHPPSWDPSQGQPGPLPRHSAASPPLATLPGHSPDLGLFYCSVPLCPFFLHPIEPEQAKQARHDTGQTQKSARHTEKQTGPGTPRCPPCAECQGGGRLGEEHGAPEGKLARTPLPTTARTLLLRTSIRSLGHTPGTAEQARRQEACSPHRPVRCSTRGPATNPRTPRAALLRDHRAAPREGEAGANRDTRSHPHCSRWMLSCPGCLMIRRPGGHRESALQEPSGAPVAIWTHSSLHRLLPTGPPTRFSHTNVPS